MPAADRSDKLQKGLGNLSDYIREKFDGSKPLEFNSFVKQFERGVKTLKIHPLNQYNVFINSLADRPRDVAEEFEENFAKTNTSLINGDDTEKCRLAVKLLKDLIEHMKIQMPDAFLKRWIQMNNENPLTEEQLEKEYPSYADSMRWQLLQQAVMKDADMRVTGEELEEEAKKVIGAQYAQYGMPLEGEMLDNFAKNALANDDERRRIADIIIERKVVDNLKPRVTIKDKSVSFEDFAKVAAEVR